VDGETMLEAADEEPESDPSRLELLAVVRGLEALDQPSRVTLVTSSRYVTRGLRFGLEEWRENNWQWERFGEMQRVRNWDLWQRIDRAMSYHRVDCRTWRFDLADEGPPACHLAPHATPSSARGESRPFRGSNRTGTRQSNDRGMLATCRRLLRGILQKYWAGSRGGTDLQAA